MGTLLSLQFEQLNDRYVKTYTTCAPTSGDFLRSSAKVPTKFRARAWGKKEDKRLKKSPRRRRATGPHENESQDGEREANDAYGPPAVQPMQSRPPHRNVQYRVLSRLLHPMAQLCKVMENESGQ